MTGTRPASELDALFDELTDWADARSRPVETLRYGGDPSQVIDLRLPERRDLAPVALVLHGGFWRAPFTRHSTNAVCAALTAAGWATANVEYRRLGPGAYAAMLADVAAARGHLDGVDAPLDVTRVTAIGHSAGGHLALWLAASGGARSVVALAGVCDLADAARARLGDGATQEFLGGEPDEVPAAYAEADPAARLPLGVPQILVHGARDDRVPIDHAKRYAARARAAGDDCALLTLAGADHFDVIDPRTKHWPRILAAATSVHITPRDE
jgi:acetyl esterase/lipase